MSIAAHGNWCGPGWSARQWKDAKDLTEEDKKVPAIDALDQACKNHDIGIAEGDPNANANFYKEAFQADWFGIGMTAAVALLGPASHLYLRGEGNMPKQPSRNNWSSTKKQKAVIEKMGLLNDVDGALRLDRQSARESNPLQSIQDAIDRLNPEEETKEMEVTPDGNFETPPVMRRSGDPTMTREDATLRGPQPNGKGSLSNRLDTADMEIQGIVESSARAADGNTDGNLATHGSVMPKYNLPREIGFVTETRSAMLPLTIYFSVNKLDSNAPVVLKFLLNDTFDIFRNTTVQPQTYPVTATNYSSAKITHAAHTITNVAIPGNNTEDTYVSTCDVSSFGYTQRSKGISNDMATAMLLTSDRNIKLHKPIGQNGVRAYQFPATTQTSTAGNTTLTGQGKFGYGSRAAQGDYAMAWRNYYERVYRNRHVMQTDWKLTMESAQSGGYHRGVVLNATETVTTQTVATPVLPTDRPLAQMLRYKRIKEHRLSSFDAQGGKTVDIISGSWSPNKTIRRDVVDDEKCRVWYPTQLPNGPSGFDWQEYETLLFYNDEMSNMQNAYYNCKLELLYHVQYRDLVQDLRFPLFTDNTAFLSVTDMTYPHVQYAAGTNWPSAKEPTPLEAYNLAFNANTAMAAY